MHQSEITRLQKLLLLADTYTRNNREKKKDINNFFSIRVLSAHSVINAVILLQCVLEIFILVASEC